MPSRARSGPVVVSHLMHSSGNKSSRRERLECALRFSQDFSQDGGRDPKRGPGEAFESEGRVRPADVSRRCRPEDHAERAVHLETEEGSDQPGTGSASRAA